MKMLVFKGKLFYLLFVGLAILGGCGDDDPGDDDSGDKWIGLWKNTKSQVYTQKRGIINTWTNENGDIIFTWPEKDSGYGVFHHSPEGHQFFGDKMWDIFIDYWNLEIFNNNWNGSPRIEGTPYTLDIDSDFTTGVHIVLKEMIFDDEWYFGVDGSWKSTVIANVDFWEDGSRDSKYLWWMVSWANEWREAESLDIKKTKKKIIEDADIPMKHIETGSHMFTTDVSLNQHNLIPVDQLREADGEFVISVDSEDSENTIYDDRMSGVWTRSGDKLTLVFDDYERMGTMILMELK